MKTVMVINQKGGVGKTTIADELAFALERAGKKVNFLTTDPQGGSVRSDTSNSDKADFEVIDTPGFINDNLPEWCRAADMILIPVVASSRDIEPSVRTYEVAKKEGHAPIMWVLNMYNPRGTLERDFEGWADSEGYNIIARIPRTAAIPQAATLAKSVGQYRSTNKATAAFDELAAAIIKKL